MARMFPPVLYPGCSAGERYVFEQLARTPEADDWLVFHSVWLPEHVRHLEGEADFVVIVPTLGVACLEVKGARQIRIEHGVWYYGNDPEGDRRGPFRQADEAMHSLRKSVMRSDASAGSVPFMHGVITPFVALPIAIEVPASQTVDEPRIKRRGFVGAIHDVLKDANTKLIAAGVVRSGEPTRDQCLRLQKLIRPSYELSVSPRALAEARELELRRYTEEQFLALDILEYTDRVIIDGPAGTGKTLLAVESAQRAVARGKQVLFLCFNKLLGGWLKEQCASLGPALVCGHLHSFLERIVPTSATMDRGRPTYWEKDLPAAAIDILLGGCEQFDELIVDEAQDILSIATLDVLDLLLKGGLDSGRWRFFADFERQTIHRTPSAHGLQRLRKAPSVVSAPLRINCRNPRRIARAVEVLGGLSPGYTRIRRDTDTGSVDFVWYSNDEEQEEAVIQKLRELKKRVHTLAEIVLLSPRTDSCGKKLQASRPKEFAPLQQRRHDQVGFATVHAFKGCEAAVIILTDISSIDGELARDLFYVGTTRATDVLVVSATSSVRSEMLSIMTEKR